MDFSLTHIWAAVKHMGQDIEAAGFFKIAVVSLMFLILGTLESIKTVYRHRGAKTSTALLNENRDHGMYMLTAGVWAIVFILLVVNEEKLAFFRESGVFWS